LSGHPFLETNRLVLRRFTKADLENLVELHGDPEVMRFTTGRPTPRQIIERETLPLFFDFYRRYPSYGYWAAIEKPAGEFVGWFHLRPAEGEPEDELEIGYRLKRSALGARRVFAQTMAVHSASRRVMEKAGLKYVKTFHETWPDPIPGAEKGEVEYGLTREEWNPGT
jgi:RimJ/RimL family protein N-acetyltransferase